MCGIFGFVSLNRKEINIPTVQRALNTMRHRGPDDEGYLIVDSRSGSALPCKGSDTIAELQLPNVREHEGASFDIIFGHRRLSILDLSSAGHQPMSSNDKRYWIILNGEVYNYLELRKELEKEGFSFHTATDTEVVLAAYQRWGTSVLHHFVGMFAFAIYDVQSREIFLARDFFGIKPLYYVLINGQFIFASEIKALLELPFMVRKPDPQQLYEYLRFGIIDGSSETLFEGIHELPPAHFLKFELGFDTEVNPVQYWQIDLLRKINISEDEAGERTRDLLESSVRLHLRSDVPLGACLSGGLDSTAILMMMARNNLTQQSLNSFSFITDDPVLSEEKYVNIACDVTKAICHKVRPTPEELAIEFEDLIRIQELPFGSTSIYAQYRVFQLASKKGIKVMLDGQGSDEIFAGYYNLIGARITGLLSSGRLLETWRVLQGTPNNMKKHFLRMLLSAGGNLLPEFLIPLFRWSVLEPLWPSWMNSIWFKNRGVVARERACGRGKDALRKELILSFSRLSLPQLLRYEDRNSMCHSIESRVPFCVPQIAEFALSLPDELLISAEGNTKMVLKKALHGIVPDAIIDREKVGFGTPEREWLTALIPYIEKTMDAVEDSEMPFLNNAKNEVKRAIRGNGRWPAHAWRIFNIYAWFRVQNISTER